MSADAFAVAVSKGMALRHPKPAEALRTGAIFGAVEATTPVIGWLFGVLASRFITSIDHWIAFVILVGLGVHMIAESFRRAPCQEKPKRHKLGALIVAAIGSSIDAMGVGVTLAFIDANIWVTSLAIGGATFLMASLGVMTGHALGCKAGKAAEVFGGIILIAIGTQILTDHLGVI